MLAVPVIRHSNQSLVKTFLICAALVPAHKQNRLTLWVKCKSHTPDLAHPVKSHLFHVGVRSAFERIYCWTSQIGAKLRQQLGMREQFVLQFFIERRHLISKVIVKLYGPSLWGQLWL